MPGPMGPSSGNRLLAAAAPTQLDQLLRSARVAKHEHGHVLFAAGDVVEELFFPLDGLISLTVNTQDGTAVEVAILGSTGFAGVDRYLGTPVASSNAVVQVAGGVIHVPADEFIAAAAESVALQLAVAAFLRSLLVETSQSAVCNQLHSVEQRTARWLSRAADQAQRSDLRLTHEFLAQMLAVRRSSVTGVVGTFTKAQLIETRRGLINIADRDGLRGLACECYEVVRAATP